MTNVAKASTAVDFNIVELAQAKTDAGAALSVAMINGSIRAVGIPITLKNGAKITVQANGDVHYDETDARVLNVNEVFVERFSVTYSNGVIELPRNLELHFSSSGTEIEPVVPSSNTYLMSSLSPAGQGGIPLPDGVDIEPASTVYEVVPAAIPMRTGETYTSQIVLRAGQVATDETLVLTNGTSIDVQATNEAPIATTKAELVAQRQAHIDAGNTGSRTVILRRAVDIGDLNDIAGMFEKPSLGGKFVIRGENQTDLPLIGRVHALRTGAQTIETVGAWRFEHVRFEMPLAATATSMLQIAGEDFEFEDCEFNLNILGPLDDGYRYIDVDPGQNGVQKSCIYASYCKNLKVRRCSFTNFGDGAFISSVGGLEITGCVFDRGHNDYIRIWCQSSGVQTALGNPGEVAYPVGLIAWNVFKNFLADSSRLHPDFIHIAGFSVGGTDFLPGISLLMMIGNLMYIGETQITTTGVIDRVLNNAEASLENVTANLVMNWPGYGNLFDNVLAYAQPLDGQILEIELPDPATSWWVSTGQTNVDNRTFAAVVKQTDSTGVVRISAKTGDTFDLVLPDETVLADQTTLDVTRPLDSYQFYAISDSKFLAVEPPRGHQAIFAQLNGMHQISGVISMFNIIFVNSTAAIGLDRNTPALPLYRRSGAFWNLCMPVITGDADGDGYANTAEDGSALGRNGAVITMGDNGTNHASKNVAVKTVTGNNIAWPDNTTFGPFFQDTIPDFYDVAAPGFSRTLHPFTDEEAIALARPRAGTSLPADHGPLTPVAANDHIDYVNRRSNRPAPVLNAVPDLACEVGTEVTVELSAYRGPDVAGDPGPVIYWIIDTVRRVSGTTAELPKTDPMRIDPMTGTVTFTAAETFENEPVTVLLVGPGGASEIRTFNVTATGSAATGGAGSIEPDFDFMAEVPTSRSGTNATAIPFGYEVTAGENSPRLRWDLSGAGLTDGKQYVMYWNANTTGNVMIRAWSSPEFTGTSTLYYNDAGGSGAMLITFDASRPYFEYLHLSAGVGSVTQVTGLRLEPWLATVWPGSVADWSVGDGAPSLSVNEGDLVFDGTGAMVSGKHTVSGLQDMQIVVNVDTISGGVLLDIVTDNIALGADLDVQVGRNVLTLTAADNGTPTSTDIEVSLYAPVSGTVRISSIYIEEA